MSSKFKKTKENFKCENCGTDVVGNGFTNHCPKCLYSEHIDIFPGDRSADCGGLMEPIDTEESGREWRIVQKCRKCGKIYKNKISKEDNFDKIIEISVEK